MAEVRPKEGSGQTLLLKARKDRRSEILTEAYEGTPEALQRKMKFRCRGGREELVHFDIFAFNSKFIRNIAFSLQDVLHLNYQDPCPVILLPETSPGVIRKIESMLQTGDCIIRRKEEAPEIFEVADMLGLPISGRRRSPERSQKKTSKSPNPMNPTIPVVSATPSKSIQRGSGKETKATKPVHLARTLPKDVLSTPKRSGASLTRGSCLSGEHGMMSPVGNATPDNSVRRDLPKDVLSTPKRSGARLTTGSCLSGEHGMMSPVGNVTPDNSLRRDSIMSNCDTPTNVMYLEPVDEFLTKGGDSRPEKRSHRKPLTTKNCNYELTCEVCGKAKKTALALEYHVCAHFKEDLEAKVSGSMTENNKCITCGDSFKTKNGLITHLGSKHGDINKVLVDKGFAVLPCRVNSSGYTDSKQQQLVKIKAERKEAVEEARLMDDLMGICEGTSQDVLD